MNITPDFADPVEHDSADLGTAEHPHRLTDRRRKSYNGRITYTKLVKVLMLMLVGVGTSGFSFFVLHLAVSREAWKLARTIHWPNVLVAPGIVSAYAIAGLVFRPRVEPMTYTMNDHRIGDVAMAVLAWTVCIATGIIVMAFLFSI